MKSSHNYYTGKLLSCCLFILSLFISCKKFVDIKPAPNLTETATVFSNDQTAISAVAGVYIQMRGPSRNFTNGGMSIFGGLSSDEIYNTATSPIYDPYYKNALLSTTSTVFDNFWSPAYRNIYRINAILEGLETSGSVTLPVKNQLTGEMKMTRAFYYFYLVNLFGDVPLVITTDYRINAIMPRTPVAHVYQQIVADLISAQSLLSSTYISVNRGRPNKWTAASLLARVYLYQKDWANAEAQAAAVINSNMYSLETDLNKVFLIASNETIWQLASTGDAVNTDQGAIFIPASASATAKPVLALTTHLSNAFELNDQRKTKWTKTNINGGVSYPYPYKYKQRTPTPLVEYNVVFRLAEQYLIRAEARAQQNNIPGAQSDLNIIRNRAGLADTTAITQADLLIAIEHERRIELFTEWADRWLNLKRTDHAEAVLSPIKANWQNTDVLYPLPFVELERNVFLTQNPGY